MNHNIPSSSLNAVPHSDALHARVAYRIAAQLTAQTRALPHDITERLRVSRDQAIQRGRASRTVPEAAQQAITLGSVLGWMGTRNEKAAGLWLKFASVLPLVALVVGLVVIQNWHGENEISAAAEIDASLLADDLPPSAYSDSGFVEFLKTPRE